ncbi:lipopolysaccharide heptosyltransferase II [Candidatus Omnitrophota bacterium]
MKRILIVNVNWLGDTLFATPFIKTVKENYPKSYIAIFTHSRCREILEGNPYIDEIIIYDEKDQHKHLLGRFSIVSQLKSKRFHMAFILRRSLSRTMLLFLSKIPERIGYDNKKSGFLLTKRIPSPCKDLHRVEHFLGIARGMGMKPKSVSYDFFISKEDDSQSEKILKDVGLENGEDFIVVNPGGNWDLKRWPAENFAKLADEIIDRFKMKVVLTGAEKDIGLCKKISGLMKNTPLLVCGKTNLKTLGAIFKKAKKVISNDSGPMHIAVGVRTPVVALFGPTSPQITGPYGEGVYDILQKEVDCNVPCYKLSCEDNKCMKAITVENVLGAIK